MGQKVNFTFILFSNVPYLSRVCPAVLSRPPGESGTSGRSAQQDRRLVSGEGDFGI